MYSFHPVTYTGLVKLVERERKTVGNSCHSHSRLCLEVWTLRAAVGIPRLGRALGALTRDQRLGPFPLPESLLTGQLIAWVTSLCLKEVGNLCGMKPHLTLSSKVLVPVRTPLVGIQGNLLVRYLLKCKMTGLANDVIIPNFACNFDKVGEPTL